MRKHPAKKNSYSAIIETWEHALNAHVQIFQKKSKLMQFVFFFVILDTNWKKNFAAIKDLPTTIHN